MPDKSYDKYTELTNKIIESPSFGKSKTYANLLKYLVEGTISGNVPKETTIAQEIFGNQDFDPSESTIVRVYVYNLRKKLKKYYSHEGTDDPVRITIPKGSYKVEFIEPKPSQKSGNHHKKSQKPRYLQWAVLLLLLFSVGLNFLLWKLWSQEQDSFKVIPQESIWSDILQSKLPAHVLLGDLYIYEENNPSTGVRTIRNPSINSQKDFEEYHSENPERGEKLQTMTYSFLIRNSSEWIKDLTPIFFTYHKDFNIRYMTQFNSKDLQDNHIVIIGMLKTFGLFNNYFDNSNFNFLQSAGTIQYQNDEMIEPESYAPAGNPDAYHTDYGFIAKFPGPNNNIVIMCGGIWDTGASQSLKHLTDPELLTRLENRMREKYNHVPKYFEVLLEVNGVDRTELSPKILHVGKIDPDKNLWAVN